MRHRLLAIAILAATFVGAACAASHADDSAMEGIGGGAVAPMANHPSVRMVSETVNIRLSDRGAKVHCEFAFKNEGPKCLVKMGFPERAWSSGEGGWMILYGFKSWVDGKPVKCVYKQAKDRSKPDARQRNWRSWYVKSVPFDARQTRKVVDEYSTNLGAESDSLMSAYEIPRSFNYVLTTGRNWKGPIGKATIIADTSRVTLEHYELEPNPCAPDVTRTDRSLTWTFTNFEPDFDVSIDLIPRHPMLNGKMTDTDLWTPLNRVGGVTMTGLKFLEQLGAETEYPETHGFIVISYGGHTLKLKPGSKIAALDGKTITLQAAPDKGVYPADIPAASVVRALGGKARYDTKDHRLQLWLKDLSAKP